MATNYPTNEHRTNYSRLCRAVIDLSTDVLRDLLNKQVLPVDILTEIRNIPDSTKVIRKDQWVYIHNAAHLRTYEKFDITLLSSAIRLLSVRDVTSILQQSLQYQTLQTSVQQCPALSTDPKTKLSKQEERDLQNIITANSFRHGKDELLWKLYTHLCTSNQKPVHPTVPWGSPNMPDPAHITVGDDIERLRHIRNKAYGHVSTSEISKKEYNTYMGILETVMVRMDKEIPGKGYKAALDRIKVTCMDAELEKKFLDDMKKMSESEKAMQEEIKEIKDEFTGIKQDVSGVKEDVSGIKEDASGIKEDVSGIKKEFKGIKEDISKFKKDFPEIKDDVSGIKEDVSVMQEDASVIKGDFSGIKKEVLEMKADFSGMEEGVSEMKEDVLEMKEDVSEIKEDVLGMKVDFSEIKEDLSGIKGDVAGTKEDVSGIKDHVSGMKDDVSGIKNDVSGIQKDVSGTKEDVAGLKKDMQQVKGSLVKEEIRNFCDQATLQIERHKKDKTFVITEAVNKGKDLLEEHGVLIYTGCPGQGKTKNALEVMKQLQNINPDWKFIELDDVRKWKHLIDPNVPSVVLLNDIIGKTNIDAALINEGDEHFPNILASVVMGKVKVIMTIRNILLEKNKVKLEKYKLFDMKHTLDLTSDEFKLNEVSKKDILRRHFENNGIIACGDWEGNHRKVDINDEKSVITLGERDISDIIKTDPVIGFPFACYLFCCKRKYTHLGPKFFKKPTQHVLDEISSLVNSEATYIDKVQYCIMVYMMLKNGKLEDDFEKDMFSKITKSVKISELPSKREKNEAIEKLLNKYIVRGVNSRYEFKHQTILESVAVCFHEDDPHLLLELCTWNFITEFVRPQDFRETEGDVVCKVDREVYSTVSNRFLAHFYTNEEDQWLNFLWWIYHPLLNDNSFVDCLINAIQSKENDQNFKTKYRSRIVHLIVKSCDYTTTYFLEKLYTLLTPAEASEFVHYFHENSNEKCIKNITIKNFIWMLDHNIVPDRSIKHRMNVPHVSLINHPRVSLKHVLEGIDKLCSRCDSCIIKVVFRRWPDLEYCHVLTMFQCFVLYNRPVDCIITLIKCRPDIISDENIKQVFTFACAKNNMEIVDCLLQIKHDNVNSKIIHIHSSNNDKLTNLHIAAFFGSFDVCKKLVELGLRLDDRTVSGLSVLQIAILGYCFGTHDLHKKMHVIKNISKSFVECVMKLEKYIPNQTRTAEYIQLFEYVRKNVTIMDSEFDLTVDIHGNKLTHFCVLRGDLALVEKLRNINKALDHVTNNDGMSGIHVAALFGRPDIFMKFVEFGVSVSGNTTTSGLSLLQLAMVGYSNHRQNISHSDLSFLKNPLIDSYIISVDSRLSFGKLENFNEIITFLLQHEGFLHTDLGMDVDEYRCCLAHYSVLHGDLSLIEMLFNIDKKLFYVTNNANMSAIHIAASSGKYEAFVKLIEFGVCVSGTTDESPLSVLQLAMLSFVSTITSLNYNKAMQHFYTKERIQLYIEIDTEKYLLGYEQIIIFLLEKDKFLQKDFDMEVDMFGNSFIHYFVVSNSLSLIKVLIKKMPQLLSLEENKVKAIRGATVKSGIDIVASHLKMTPLELSVILGRCEISKYLLSCSNVSNGEASNLIQLADRGERMAGIFFLRGKIPNCLNFISFSLTFRLAVVGSKAEYETIQESLKNLYRKL